VVDEGVEEVRNMVVFIKQVDEVLEEVRNMVVFIKQVEILYLADDNNLFI